MCAAVAKLARVEGGAARLGNWLHLRVHCAPSLALASSPDAAVRAMTPTVFERLLGHAPLPCVCDGQRTMGVDGLAGVAERRCPLALVEALKPREPRYCRVKVVVGVRARSLTKAS